MKTSILHLSIFILQAAYSVFSAEALLAQNKFSDTSATWVAYWQAGESQRYHMYQVESKYQGSKLLTQDSLSQDIFIRILEENEQNYRLSWKASHSPELIIQTDELGAFEKVEGEEALKSILQTYIAQNVRDSLAPSAQKIVSPDLLFSSYIQKLSIFFFPYGNKYTTKGLRFNTSFDNPINGSKIPGYYHFQLIRTDHDRSQARLRIEKGFEPEAFKGILIDLVQQFSETPLSEEEMAEELKNFKAFESYEYILGLPSGWQEEVIYTKHFQMGDSKTILQISFQKED